LKLNKTPGADTNHVKVVISQGKVKAFKAKKNMTRLGE